jgi:hypothetical protein
MQAVRRGGEAMTHPPTVTMADREAAAELRWGANGRTWRERYGQLRHFITWVDDGDDVPLLEHDAITRDEMLRTALAFATHREGTEAAIVAFIRGVWVQGDAAGTVKAFADSIERGEHRR